MKARRCWETKSRFGILKERANKEERGRGREGKAKWMDVWWFTGLWSGSESSGCVRELMEEMICETPWWVEFDCLCVCQHGLPRLSGSQNACQARPKRFWRAGPEATARLCAHVCVRLRALLNPSTPYISTWWLCAWTYLQLSFHMCACTHMSEIDSRWTKDVQQRKGPAGSNCTEYSVYYQQHNRFKATCSLTVPITVTSYTMEPCNTTKEGGKNRTRLF